MKLTFCYVSNRPGSIDILGECLEKQSKAIPWELVVIDGHPGRVERGNAERYLRDKGIPVSHYGLPKTRTFPWSRTGFVNAMNTGLMYANGTHVVFLHDFVKINDDAVVRWANAFLINQACLIQGAAITYSASQPDVADDILTWSRPEPWVAREPWIPDPFDLGYWGGPMEFFEQCNGIDERADWCSEWALDCVAVQAAIHNYGLYTARDIICHMIDHRAWHKGEAMDGLYRTRGELSNVPIKPEWSPWSANPFHLKEVRRHLLQEKK